jgi:hypothetical protein
MTTSGMWFSTASIMVRCCAATMGTCACALQLSPGGRQTANSVFLLPDDQNGLWGAIGPKQRREKGSA